MPSGRPRTTGSADLRALVNAGTCCRLDCSGQQPVAASFPELCFKFDDLYEGRLLVQGNLLDVRRDTAELARLLEVPA